MKKLLIALGILAFIVPAYGRVLDLWVGDGTGVPDTYNQDTGDSYFEACMELDGDLNIDGYLWLSDGTAALPSVFFDSEPGDDTGAYWIGDNSFGVSVNGVWNTIWDVNGITVIGIDGPIGAITPAAGIFTTVDGTDGTFTGDLACDGDFVIGQEPADLHTGYKDRSDYMTWQDDFTDGVDALYAVKWNIAGVVGLGTNTLTVRDGWSELVTAAAGGPDMESTVAVSPGWVALAAPRLEAVVELTAVNTQRFEIGWYIAGNELVEIVYDTAIGPNWMLQVDDTTGMETIDSLIAVVGGTPYKLEIAVDVAGNVTWAIDDAALGLGALANIMTANPYSTRWMLTNIAAAANTAAVDYVQIEYLKVQ